MKYRDSAFKNSLPAILSCVKIAFRPVLFLSWKRRQEQSLLIHLFANLLVGYPHSVTRIGLWSSYHPAVHHKSGRRRLSRSDLLESIRLPDFSVYSIDFVADSSPGPGIVLALHPTHMIDTDGGTYALLDDPFTLTL